MTLAVIVGAVLVLMTFGFHYVVLRAMSVLLPSFRLSLEARVMSVIFAAFGAHIVEVLIYAVAYFVAVEVLGIGAFGGVAVESALDYFYFSIVSYTSLGLGDVFPHGHVRFLTGLEALNGLMLIAWSASFAYLAMGRLWPWRPCD